MKKFSAKSSEKPRSLPAWAWVAIGVVGAAVLIGGSYAVFKAIAGPAPPLPSAADGLPSLPRPQLPGGGALPENPADADLPGGPALPEADYPGTQLPGGPALPEGQEPEPKPEEKPEVIYYAASVYYCEEGETQRKLRELFGEELMKTPGFSVPAGMQGVLAYYRISNQSSASIWVDFNSMVLEYQGRPYRPPSTFSTGFAAGGNADYAMGANVLPGETTGWKCAYFELPKGATGVLPILEPGNRPPNIEVRRVANDKLPQPSTYQERGIHP